MFKTLNELIDLIKKLKDITYVVAKRNGNEKSYVYLDDSTKDHSSQSKYEYKGYKICFTDSVFDANFFIEKDAEDIRNFLKEENKDNNNTTWMILGFSSLLDKFKISIEDEPKIILAQDKEDTQDQPKEKKYYVGLLDPKNHIFKYVCSSILICDGYDVNNEIFSKLFEKDIFTSSVTSYNTKIFTQSQLDEFMEHETIKYLMYKYNLGIYTFDTSINTYDDIATDIRQYYIYYLTDKDIVFFNGFLNNKDVDLKLEDNIERAQLFNRAETIVNINRMEENRTSIRKWDIIKKNDPLLRDLLKKVSECV